MQYAGVGCGWSAAHALAVSMEDGAPEHGPIVHCQFSIVNFCMTNNERKRII